MDRPTRPPDPPPGGPSGQSSEADAKATKLRQTTALPPPELTPRQQRAGVRTEVLAPPPDELPTRPPAAATQAPQPPTGTSAPLPLTGTPAPQPPIGPPPRAAVSDNTSGNRPEAKPEATAEVAATPPPAIETRPARASRPARPPSSGLRIAARSRPQLPRPIAWGLGLALVLVAGLVAWMSRQDLSLAFDRWLTLPSWQAEQSPPTEPLVEPATPAATVPQESGPVWTFETIEAALGPLPAQLQTLSDAGKVEQEDFADLARRQAPAALRRSRWENWRLVWGNRTAQLRQAMPPLDVCLPHAALESTCLATDEALEALERLVDLPDPEAAPTHLACADAVLAAWRRAEEEALTRAAAAAVGEPGLDDTAEAAIEVEDLLRPEG